MSTQEPYCTLAVLDVPDKPFPGSGDNQSSPFLYKRKHVCKLLIGPRTCKFFFTFVGCLPPCTTVDKYNNWRILCHIL